MFLKKNFLFFFFLLMENLGAMAYSRYTGFREITHRNILELHCSHPIRHPSRPIPSSAHETLVQINKNYYLNDCLALSNAQ